MSLDSLFLIFVKVGFLSFGGSASLPLLQDEFVRQRSLLTDEHFAWALAIGRIAPGPNGLFVIPVGYFLAGLPGALVATLAICVPAVAVLVLLKVYHGIAHLAPVSGATKGVTFGTIGLLFAIAALLLRGTLRGPGDVAIAAVACAALLFTRIDGVVVLAVAGGVGVAVFLLGAA